MATDRAITVGLYQDPKYNALELSDRVFRAHLRKVYVSAAKSRRQKRRREDLGEEVVDTVKVRPVVTRLCVNVFVLMVF
jgi:hypothetical protein